MPELITTLATSVKSSRTRTSIPSTSQRHGHNSMFELDAIQDVRMLSLGYTEYVMPEGVMLIFAATRPINYQLARRANTITTYFNNGTKAILKDQFKEIK